MRFFKQLELAIGPVTVSLISWLAQPFYSTTQDELGIATRFFAKNRSRLRSARCLLSLLSLLQNEWLIMDNPKKNKDDLGIPLF